MHLSVQASLPYVLWLPLLSEDTVALCNWRLKSRLTHTVFMWCLVVLLLLELCWKHFGSKVFESAQSACRETKQMVLILTNCRNASGLLPNVFFYKLGHNAAVIHSIPHLYGTNSMICVPSAGWKTHRHKHIQALTGIYRHHTCRIVDLAGWRQWEGI